MTAFFEAYYKRQNSHKLEITKEMEKHMSYKLTNTVHNAKKRNLNVNITMNDIKEQYQRQYGRCALSGVVMTFGQSLDDLSIDRKDSKRGYTKDNIQLVSNVVNTIKSDDSNDIFLNKCDKIVNDNRINLFIKSKQNKK